MSPSSPSPTSEHVVDALIARRLLTPTTREDAIGVVTGVLHPPAGTSATPEAPGRRGLPQLVEVVAYLGGALVLAAGGLFLAEAWEDLGFGGRVTMLGVVALVLLFSGVVSSRASTKGGLPHEADDPRRRLAGTLITGAALTVAVLVVMVVDEYLDLEGDDYSLDIYWPVVAGALLGVLVAAAGYRIAPTALGLLGILGGVVTMVTNLVNVIDDDGLASGVAIYVIGAAWLAASEQGWFRELTVARAAGVVTAFWGAQVLVIEGHSWLGYLLTVLVAVLGIVIYLARVAWPYLAGAVLSVTVVVPEMVADWTDGSVGAIGGVLVTGITLLLASFAGYQLRVRAVD